MNNAREKLKKAFIDSQIVDYSAEKHNFSQQFEIKMLQIIKAQKGFHKFINTTKKKVACLAIAIVLCLTTVACGIKEVREPIIKEIKKFYVNAKEILTGTEADKISHLFPTEVTKIVGTSYISKSKKQYIIDDPETITSFVELFSKTYWGEPDEFDEFEDINTYWTFDFYNEQEKSLFQVKMCNDIISGQAKIAIIKNGEEKHYYIYNQTYREILAFTNKKYYLHDSEPNSKLQNNNEEYFKSCQEEITKGLTEAETKEISKIIRKLHYEIESFLLREVSHLKEADSIYWDHIISQKPFLDPITNQERQYDINGIMLKELEDIISIVKNEKAKQNLSKALDIWQESIKTYNLGGLFVVHEYLHDYDYYAINYPTNYVYDEDVDYQGLDDYFGHLAE